MMVVLGLILAIPLGWYGPRLGAQRLGGDVGAAIGAAGALILGFAAIYALAFVMAAATGGDPKLEFEAGVNAWKLLIILAPASAIHVRRQQRRAEAAEEGGDS